MLHREDNAILFDTYTYDLNCSAHAEALKKLRSVEEGAVIEMPLGMSENTQVTFTELVQSLGGQVIQSE